MYVPLTGRFARFTSCAAVTWNEVYAGVPVVIAPASGRYTLKVTPCPVGVVVIPDAFNATVSPAFAVNVNRSTWPAAKLRLALPPVAIVGPTTSVLSNALKLIVPP